MDIFDARSVFSEARKRRDVGQKRETGRRQEKCRPRKWYLDSFARVTTITLQSETGYGRPPARARDIYRRLYRDRGRFAGNGLGYRAREKGKNVAAAVRIKRSRVSPERVYFSYNLTSRIHARYKLLGRLTIIAAYSCSFFFRRRMYENGRARARFDFRRRRRRPARQRVYFIILAR